MCSNAYSWLMQATGMIKCELWAPLWVVQWNTASIKRAANVQPTYKFRKSNSIIGYVAELARTNKFIVKVKVCIPGPGKVIWLVCNFLCTPIPFWSADEQTPCSMQKKGAVSDILRTSPSKPHFYAIMKRRETSIKVTLAWLAIQGLMLLHTILYIHTREVSVLKVMLHEESPMEQKFGICLSSILATQHEESDIRYTPHQSSRAISMPLWSNDKPLHRWIEHIVLYKDWRFYILYYTHIPARSQSWKSCCMKNPPWSKKFGVCLSSILATQQLGII